MYNYYQLHSYIRMQEHVNSIYIYTKTLRNTYYILCIQDHSYVHTNTHIAIITQETKS